MESDSERSVTDWKELDRRIQSSELAVIAQRLTVVETQIGSIQQDIKNLDQRADRHEAHSVKIETHLSTIEKFIKWGFAALVGSGAFSAGNFINSYEQNKVSPLPEPPPQVRQIPNPEIAP